MSSFPTRPAPLLAALTAALGAAGGCVKPPPPPAPLPPPPGVSVLAAGDTRGTVLYHPAPPRKPPDPYAPVSDKFVIAQRQELAWELAEIDQHAHAQAARTYPVPDPSWRGYTKQKAVAQALRQAQFNAYLLEKHHAHFCNRFRLSYDQLVLIIKEGREKNWPAPPAPKE